MISKKLILCTFFVSAFASLVFGVGVEGALYWDCALKANGQWALLKSLPAGSFPSEFISTDVEIFWGDLGVAGVKCAAKTTSYSENSSDSCSSGYAFDLSVKSCVEDFCNPAEAENCQKECKTKTDCPNGWECDVDHCYQSTSCCENTKMGCSGAMGCVVVVSADKDQCICANGKPDCGQSPMCLKEFNSIYTGECIGGECKAQNIDLASSCTTDLQCWDGSGNGMNAVAKCCENSKCEGPIENCKDDHMPVCPPGFKDVGEGFGCVPDCPASGNGCQTDEDCKKGGQNKVCVELTKDSFMTDKEVGLEACKLKGITKQCEFKKGAGAPSSTPPADIPFSIPSAAGLNNLSVDSVPKLIGNIIEKLMGVMGSIALAMFVYGGVLWMISAGNSEKSKKGMQIIVWSALGIMVILASYVIVGFVFEAFK